MSKHIVIDARIRRSSTGRYTDRLLEHLQEIDTKNTYTVLIELDDPWQPKASNFSVAPCRYKQFSLNPLEQLGFMWQLYQLKPDLVHFTMTQQPLLYFGNIVTTTHDLTMLEYARAGRLPQWVHKVRLIAYRMLLWWSHRKSNKIITPTKYVADDIAQLHPFSKKKLVVTYEASEPALKANAIKPDCVQRPYLLYVGRAFPHKNLGGLLMAFDELALKYDDLRVAFVGKKEFYYNELEQAVSRYKVKDRVVFTDFVSDEELKWLYQNAEAYVFPSLSEGFGLPGLEAMVYGCPVVSSNATCLPEVYGEAAEYFDPKNTDDMVHAIERVINDKARRSELIKLGYKQAKKYSWHRMAEQTLATYNSVLHQP